LGDSPNALHSVSTPNPIRAENLSLFINVGENRRALSADSAGIKQT
jgi:hypothetical protein